ALNKSSTADFTGCSVLRDQFLELLVQVAAYFHYVCEEALFFHDGEVFEADAAGQRTSAECRAVLPGGNCVGEVLLRQERSERDSGGDGLGYGDYVGHHVETLEGEDLAGAPETALDFVEDESGVMMIGKSAAGEQEFLRTLEDAAFSKNGFEHDGAGVGIDGCVQRLDVVLRHKGYVIEQRLETLAIFFLAGQGHGAKGATMIRTLQRHELRFGFASCFVAG